MKGLTFFLEDIVEIYNTIQYNLAIFTRMSNSLLNQDIIPASFWNNNFCHNSCEDKQLNIPQCLHVAKVTFCRRYPSLLLALT